MSISISSYQNIHQVPAFSCPNFGFSRKWKAKNRKKTSAWWFKVTFLGWLSDPFKGLSDLQLGDEKVTLNHLVRIFVRHHSIFRALEKHISVWRQNMCGQQILTLFFFFRGALFRVDKLCPTNFYIPTWKLMMMKMEKNHRYPPRN